MSRRSTLARISQRAGAQAYALGWVVVRWLPSFIARPAFRAIADYVWWRGGAGVRQLESNLRRVVHPDDQTELRSLTRAALRSYLRYWLEVFRLPALSRGAVADRFHVYGEERLWEALRSGRGVVLALPHSGNWDHAGAWIALSGHPFATVAERVEPESLYDRFVAFRQRLGMEVLPLTGGRKVVYASLATRLRAGGLVCLLADRDLTASGVEVSFFGEPARMPAGPATLALDTGAALVPVTLWYEGRDWAGQVHPEITVPQAGTRSEKIAAMTQDLAQEFEGSIAAHPQDWHMMQRLWTADLGRARTASGVGSWSRHG